MKKGAIYGILVIIYIIINLYSYFLMRTDKKRAIHHQSRISEQKLFCTCILFGALGIWISMQKYRHKTKHASFLIKVPLYFIFNLLTIGVILYLIYTGAF